MICPRSLVVNGNFREFSDGFEELGIPRMGSTSLSTRFPFLSLSLILHSLHEAGVDSIKRLFVANKEADEALCERHFSLLSLSPFLSFLVCSLFSPFFPFVFCFCFCFFSIPLCYASLSLRSEIYKSEPDFQGRASDSFSNENNLLGA